MKYDMPEGFEELFGCFNASPNKPMIPRKGMTTEQLIKCMEHNARIIKQNSFKTK